jgi:hypothetical protein
MTAATQFRHAQRQLAQQRFVFFWELQRGIVRTANSREIQYETCCSPYAGKVM